jgi:hypothetical protein
MNLLAIGIALIVLSLVGVGLMTRRRRLPGATVRSTPRRPDAMLERVSPSGRFKVIVSPADGSVFRVETYRWTDEDPVPPYWSLVSGHTLVDLQSMLPAAIEALRCASGEVIDE